MPWVLFPVDRRGWSVEASRALTVLWNFDDIALHRSQHAEQFTLLLRWNVEGIEGQDKVLDQRVERRACDLHALVRRFHIAARIGAGAAAGLAYLIHQLPLEVGEIGLREVAIDPLVPSDDADEFAHDSRDGAGPAEPFVERGLHIGDFLNGGLRVNGRG